MVRPLLYAAARAVASYSSSSSSSSRKQQQQRQAVTDLHQVLLLRQLHALQLFEVISSPSYVSFLSCVSFVSVALNAFVAAIPDASALAPEATTARAWSDCFVLHPPRQQQQQQQEEQHRQHDASQETDAHLLLLLSLLRPDLWPPLKLSETMQVPALAVVPS